jgi:hypothetical protein
MTDLNPPFWTKALYAYKSEYEDDLSFEVGQLVQVTAIEDDEWFTGQYTDATGTVLTGMFPKNFVSEPVQAEEKSEPVPVQEEEEVTAEHVEREEQEPENEVLYVQEPAIPVPATVPVPSESDHAALAPHKLSSRTSTFNAESSVPLPTAKVAEPALVKKKSYQGVPSSYIPPSLNKRDTTTKKADLHHSSYVPPMLGLNKPKSQEKSELPPPPPFVSSQEESDETGPKMSLHERIALLQKQQLEATERAAAALKKKTEKAENLKKTPVAETPAGRPAFPGQSQGIEAAEEDNEVVDSDDLPEAEDVAALIGSEEHDNGFVKPEKQQDEDQEEEEEEDSEEARRAALRERMAKLAGAGGMYGGFNPFGGLPSTVPGGSMKQRKKSKEPKEDNMDIPSIPVPIMPFAGGSAPHLPKALQKNVEADGEEAGEPADLVELITSSSSKTDKEQIVAVDVSDVDDEPIQENTEEAAVPETQVLEHAPEIPPLPPAVPHSMPHVPEIPPVPSPSSAPAVPGTQEIPASTSHPSSSLEERLANLDLSDIPKPQSESAVEGDDEREKDTSEDDYTFNSDKEREKRDPTLPTISRPMLNSEFGSEYNTGYESDEETVQKSYEEPLSPSATTLKSEITPPIPALSSAVPPVPSMAPIPPVTTPHKHAPPPPAPTSDVYSPATAPPVPPHVSHAPKLPPPPPIPQSPVSYETPSKPIVDTSMIQSQSQVPSPSLPKVPPPPPVLSSPASAAPPIPGMKKASTFSVDTPFEKSGSALSRDTIPRSDSLDLGSQWWLRQNELPAFLQCRVGKDLIYEMDEHKVTKRGGRQLILRDYYILHQDNSQTIINVSFQAHDPQGTLNVSQSEQPTPALHKLALDSYSQTFGVKVFQIATKLINSTLKEPLVPHILSQLPGVLQPVGLRSYGATIYTNSNNSEVHQSEDFKPGDILAINKAKFQGHNKLRQKIVYEVGNGGSPFAAVITEFDEEKRKFRVIELDANGKCKHASYKPSDMKSGKMKVFRVVGRDFVSW